MKVFDKIKGSSFSNKDKLIKIVCDLIPLRGNESKTKEYFDTYLRADDRYRIWKDERNDCIFNGCLDLNPQFNVFSHNEGEIHRYEAENFRNSLLNVLEDDKYSFAHIYNLLAQDANKRPNAIIIRNCVFDSDIIDYAIRFDVEQTINKYYSIKDVNERYEYISKIISKNDAHPYNGELKERFSKTCEGLLEFALRILSKPELGQKDFGQNEKDNNNIINEERLKIYFKAQFKGMGNGNIDRFSLLIGKIKARKWNGKEVAMIARMIYESSHSINMPTGFEEWHRTFCQLINTKYVRYRLNQTEPSDAIRSIYEIYL